MVDTCISNFADSRAIFSRNLWNHWDNEKARTNNSCEAMHNLMNKKFNKDHQNIYTLIEAVKKLEQKYDVKMLHLRVGARSRPSSLRNRKIDQKIASLKEELM
jgi:hypothetical protein